MRRHVLTSAGFALLLSAVLTPTTVFAQATPPYTRADTLRGSIGPERAWWDVTFYDLRVQVHPADSSLSGSNTITYRVLDDGQTDGRPEMQIDLQEPMVVDSVVQDGRSLEVRREGNAHFVATEAPQRPGDTREVTVHYHGQPRLAVNPPWDGGLIMAQDSLGRPWISTANQGLGASVWWPNKDTQTEEPDSQRIAITVPDPLVDVSNGRLRSTENHDDGTTTYEWFVSSPINNYSVAINAGHYAHFDDTFEGEDGELTLDFWPLDYHLDAAMEHFQQVQPTLACFEHWFGPYPWYGDGFKLVETPYLGMEHQSAVSYGNAYMNGYLGRDLSGTGWGLEWDYIIVHEAAHEWWGNNITTEDIADLWVHESFGSYSESLYTECMNGEEAGADYVIGLRGGIRNDGPIIADYGVNAEGSGDMYSKGANMLHTIRQWVNDTELWREILRGLNSEFRHDVVTGAEVQRYIAREAGLDLEPVFEQYLTTTRIPVLEYRVEGSTLEHRWTDAVEGFALPVEARIGSGAGECIVLEPTTEWQPAPVELEDGEAFEGLQVDRDYFVGVRPVGVPSVGGETRLASGRCPG